MTEETLATPRVLDALAARSAGIAHVGVVGNQGLDKIVAASYRCYVRDTDAMIAAIPLEMAQSDRTITRGANVFDFAVQGLYSENTDLTRRNVEYIFRMGPSRAEEYAKSLTDLVAQKAIVECVEGWLSALKDLPQNDLKGTEAKLDAFDELLSHVVRVRLMYADGKAESKNIGLSSSSAAQWLANYL